MSEPDRFAVLMARHDAAQQYMHSANCSWDRAARLFRCPPYQDLPPADEGSQLPPAGDDPQLERVLSYVREGMPYQEAERRVRSGD